MNGEKEDIEHPTSDTEHRSVGHDARDDATLRVEERVYDLEERLLEYAALVIRVVRDLPKDRESNHIAGQLLRSGTSPLPNHGEAEAAESLADFVHKLKICLKKLRETRRWLLLVLRVPLAQGGPGLDALLQETSELIRIFVASIRTAERRAATRENDAS